MAFSVGPCSEPLGLTCLLTLFLWHFVSRWYRMPSGGEEIHLKSGSTLAVLYALTDCRFFIKINRSLACVLQFPVGLCSCVAVFTGE